MTALGAVVALMIVATIVCEVGIAAADVVLGR
jgi:hypothetical protein